MMYEILEALRPSFWQGDYNFLWLYVFGLIIIVKLYEFLYRKYHNSTIYNPSRIQRHSQSYRDIWEKKQQELDSLTKADKSQTPRPTEEAKPDSKRQEPKIIEEEEEKKEDIKEEKKEQKIEGQETDEKLEKMKRKTDYFNSNSSSKTYKPSLRDRYPNIIKRKGG